MTSKKKKIIFSSIILFIVIIIIGYWAIYNYVFKNKQTVYIPKSLTTNLYFTKEGNCYKNTDFKLYSVLRSGPYPQEFYNSKEKSREILDYLNEFNIQEIHRIKFLKRDNPTTINKVIFIYEHQIMLLSFPNKHVFTIDTPKKNRNGYFVTIEKNYLIKDNYIDGNKIENLLKN